MPLLNKTICEINFQVYFWRPTLITSAAISIFSCLYNQMYTWKNNVCSKLAFLITLLVKKKRSQHPCCKLCTQKGKINKTWKLKNL